MGNAYEVMVRVHKVKDSLENLGVGGIKRIGRSGDRAL